jgi:hypothetical protein
VWGGGGGGISVYMYMYSCVIWFQKTVQYTWNEAKLIASYYNLLTIVDPY